VGSANTNGANSECRTVGRAVCARLAIGILLGLTLCNGALAESSNRAGKAAREIPRFEISSGIGATSHSWFGYASAVWAPVSGLDRSGLRLRAMAGYGRYDYDSVLAVGGGLVATEFQGDVTLADIMAGYAMDLGALWLKGYIGVAYAGHNLTPDDPQNDIKGAKVGVKGQVEAWLEFTERVWLSADASWSLPFGDYWTLLRVGNHFGSLISAGPEIALLGNREFSAERVGAFIRVHFGTSELTISGGLSGNYEESDSIYGSAGLYHRF